MEPVKGRFLRRDTRRENLTYIYFVQMNGQRYVGPRKVNEIKCLYYMSPF
jgi:hypothetical protein